MGILLTTLKIGERSLNPLQIIDPGIGLWRVKKLDASEQTDWRWPSTLEPLEVPESYSSSPGLLKGLFGSKSRTREPKDGEAARSSPPYFHDREGYRKEKE